MHMHTWHTTTHAVHNAHAQHNRDSSVTLPRFRLFLGQCTTLYYSDSRTQSLTQMLQLWFCTEVNVASTTLHYFRRWRGVCRCKNANRNDKLRRKYNMCIGCSLSTVVCPQLPIYYFVCKKKLIFMVLLRVQICTKGRPFSQLLNGQYKLPRDFHILR